MRHPLLLLLLLQLLHTPWKLLPPVPFLQLPVPMPQMLPSVLPQQLLLLLLFVVPGAVSACGIAPAACGQPGAQ
jgi:hypothetical protein